MIKVGDWVMPRPGGISSHLAAMGQKGPFQVEDYCRYLEYTEGKKYPGLYVNFRYDKVEAGWDSYGMIDEGNWIVVGPTFKYNIINGKLP